MANASIFAAFERFWLHITAALGNKADIAHTHDEYVNQNAFSKITVGSTTIEADTATDTLTLVAGSNVTLTPNAANDKITIATTGLATVATSGSYNDLSNKPTIPTVNNGTLTIQKNGTAVATFTADQSINATANITVPTKTSELTNDSGFKTTDNNTTYTFATGSTDGTFSVTPSGGSAQSVAIKGLGSAAYTASTAYAPISHVGDSTHVTSAEKSAWNAKSDFSGDYSDLTNAPNIRIVTDEEILSLFA
jgi:hypothetical protein